MKKIKPILYKVTNLSEINGFLGVYAPKKVDSIKKKKEPDWGVTNSVTGHLLWVKTLTQKKKKKKEKIFHGLGIYLSWHNASLTCTKLWLTFLVPQELDMVALSWNLSSIVPGIRSSRSSSATR